MAGKKEPRGLRNCNPGNIRLSKTVWAGQCAKQTDGAFVQFESMDMGYRALCKLLMIYQDKHNLRTIAGVIGRWAPASENNTNSYIRHVTQLTGYSAQQQLDLHDAETLKKMASAISKVENGRDAVVADVEAGVRLALEK